jgi:integrase/recombinase XerD
MLDEASKPGAWLPLAVSLATGLRIGDVLALRRVNVHDDHVDFLAAKTGKVGRASITPQLACELRRNAAGGKWCFPGRDPAKHLTRQAAWYRMKVAAKRGGVSAAGVSPHACRKTFAVNTLHQTGSIEAVQERLQHEYITDTCLYAFSDRLSEKH